MSDDTPPDAMTKAERLYVAGQIAPVLRAQSERARQRRVARVDKDGNVVGYIDGATLQAKILERAKIELDVAEGKRPTVIFCERCGDKRRVLPNRPTPKLCVRCVRPPCRDCGKPLREQAGYNRRITGRCNACRAALKKRRVGCAVCGKEMGQSQSYIARTRGRAAKCRPCTIATKTHCKHGHEIAVVGRDSQGACRECKRADGRRRRLAARAANS